MKFKTSNKTTSFGKKPYVKKGYYPAKLLKVTPYANKETGELIEGKYGHQLIFDFEIYAKDENDNPTTPLIFEEEGKEPVNVVIPKFLYHEYKDKKTGEYQTAFTPNSAITAAMKSLGWVFSDEDIDPEKFIGNFVEVNINDFDTKSKDGESYTASTIADIGKLKAEGELPKEKEVKEDVAVVEETPEKLQEQIVGLDKLKADGMISEEGHKQAVEQLQSKIDSLKK